MFGLRIVGISEADRRLDRLALLLSDLRSLWPLVTRLAISWESKTFDTEGEFFGDRWAPLSPEYQAWKEANYPGHDILSRTGALRRAATSPTRIATPTSLILTIEPYEVDGQEVDPSWFQEGTDRMPARPLVPDNALPAEAVAELEVVAQQYLREILARF